MNLLESEALQRKVDYSFGDHSGVLGGVPNAFMKKANLDNHEFMEMVQNHEGVMTLFIDNIRLYRRPLEYSDWMHLKPISEQDKKWLAQFDNEDLLKLCRCIPSKKFIIFTALEDTPLDAYIEIPDNVLAIHAANGVYLEEKIHPYPHGLERIMYPGYNHHEILKKYIGINPQASKLLFICHRDDTGARGSIRDLFLDKDWATVSPKLEYEPYLSAMLEHKFVLCPSGNGIESARNWETLYMKRVPIFKRHSYLEEMFKDFPVLFVDNWEEVTEDLLKANHHLYYQAQRINPNLLDLDKVYDLRCNPSK